jgi:hypothetical protein
MFWYMIFFVIGGTWIGQGLYLIAWSLFTIIRNIFFNRPYRD